MENRTTSHKDQPAPSVADEKCVTSALKGGGGFGLAGLFVSALQNSYYRHNHGAWGVFTRSGGTIAAFTMIGAVFAATECLVAKARGKRDPLVSGAAGCAAGLATGLRSRNFGLMCGACAAMGGSIWAMEMTGGWWKVPMESMSYKDRETLRENRLASPSPKPLEPLVRD